MDFVFLCCWRQGYHISRREIGGLIDQRSQKLKLKTDVSRCFLSRAWACLVDEVAMTKPLLAMLLLLPLSVSAGELDGKAIYCKWLWLESDVPVLLRAAATDVGFEFRDGRPATYWIEVKGTKAVLSHNIFFNPDDYDVTPGVVTWVQIGPVARAFSMKLDRATLLLSYNVFGGNEDPGWECDVYTSQDDFQRLMEAKRVKK